MTVNTTSGTIIADKNLLNKLVVMLGDCAIYNDQLGYTEYAKEVREFQNDIFKALKENYFYDSAK